MKFIILTFQMMIAGFVHAAQMYSVPNGSQVTINEHGVCQKVTNSCGPTMMVPTNTAGEWSNFRSNKPGCASLAACGDPVGTCHYDSYWGEYGCNYEGTFTNSTTEAQCYSMCDATYWSCVEFIYPYFYGYQNCWWSP